MCAYIHEGYMSSLEKMLRRDSIMHRGKGFTLIELIIVVIIISVLSIVAVPMIETTIKREKEIQLRRNLRIIRSAIDVYKEFVEKNQNYSEEDFVDFVDLLAQDNIEIKPIIVKRLIKNELEKNRMPDLIDLEYDLQLIHSINMLKSVNAFLKANAS